MNTDFIIITFGLLTVTSAMVNLHQNTRLHEKSVADIVFWLIIAIAGAAAVADTVCGR